MSEYYMTHTGIELDDAINKVKSGYVDKTKISHLATGVVNNVTAGQQLSVTGIKDAVTGEAFELKGVICFIHPTSATNYQTEGNKPATAAFYRNKETNESSIIAAYNANYSVRVHPTAANTYLSISGNGFSYQSMPASMYGVLAASRWRWVAWG